MRSAARRIFVALVAAVLVAGGLFGTSIASAATPPIGRWGGVDRYDTSALISSQSFAPGVSAAFVANGAGFADALSGAAAGGAKSSPLLLTYTDSVPTAVAAELRRLGPGRIYVLGGPTVVAETVLEELEGLTTGEVTRLSGEDRYATSAAISRAIFENGSRTVYLASGTAFPDALAAAPAAGGRKAPLLLTDPSALPPVIEDELRRLAPTHVVIVGGPAAVSDAVAEQIANATGAAAERVAGEDRFATSAALTRSFAPGVDTVYLASGVSFPDALAGGAAARGAPLLLVGTDSLPLRVARELRRLRPNRVILLGGTSALTATVADRSAIVTTSLSEASAGRLTRDTEIRSGTCMPSPDASHQLCVRADAGFGVYRGQSALWTSATPDAAILALRLRADGLAVLYSEDGRALWNSSTAGTSATELAMQNDGDAMLKGGSGAVWSSMTSAGSPRWRLPFMSGVSWSAGAPHANSGGTAGARGALDFGPRPGGDRRVVSIAAGTVYRVQCGGGSYLGITHANGWQSTYYHLVDYQTQLIGQYVSAGTYLGEVGRTTPCGGSATFDHVHLVIRRAGNPVSVEGMTFGGFRVHSDDRDYWGFWTDETGARVVTASGGAACCLRAE